MTRTPTLALLTLLFAAQASCYRTSSPRSPADLLTRERPSQIRVRTLAGRAVTVYAPRLVGDTIVGHAGDSTVYPVRRPSTPIAIQIDSVRFATVRRVDPFATGLGMALGAGLLLAILVVATWEGPTF